MTDYDFGQCENCMWARPPPDWAIAEVLGFCEAYDEPLMEEDLPISNCEAFKEWPEHLKPKEVTSKT